MSLVPQEKDMLEGEDKEFSSDKNYWDPSCEVKLLYVNDEIDEYRGGVTLPAAPLSSFLRYPHSPPLTTVNVLKHSIQNVATLSPHQMFRCHDHSHLPRCPPSHDGNLPGARASADSPRHPQNSAALLKVGL